MKSQWDKKYLQWGLTALLVITCSLTLYSLLFHGNNLKEGFISFLSIAMPIIDGLALAYLLAPVVNSIENRLLIPLCNKFNWNYTQKKKMKIMRYVSVVLTMLLVYIFLKSFFSLVIPQIVNSIRGIVVQFPVYVDTVTGWVMKLLEDNPDMEYIAVDILDRYSIEIGQWLNTSLIPQMNEILKTISNSLISIAKGLWNLILGFILSIYLLLSKEQFAGQGKKIIYSIFDTKHANTLIHDFRFIHKTFSGFISGKILDSIIIGILCFIVTSLMNMPYAVLVSVIVGITNVIPFFGPYLGAIPSAFLILMVDPIKCLSFVIFIIILQQFDGNILGPKILGDSTGLTGFWVIFSITLFGGIFGIMGMFIGVPVFAIFYAMVKANVERNLQKKGLPTQTAPYLKVGSIQKTEFIEFNPMNKKGSNATNEKGAFVLFEKKKSTVCDSCPYLNDTAEEKSSDLKDKENNEDSLL